MTAIATSKSPSEVLLLGHAASRRSQLLQQACARAGVALDLLDWNAFLAAPALLAQRLAQGRHRWLKIDSPGEDADCAQRLRLLGWQAGDRAAAPPSPVLHGELATQHYWQAGFGQALGWIDAAVAGAAAPPRLLNSTAGIRGMTDKWQCQRTLAAHVPVPPLLGLLHSLEQLDAQWPAGDWPRVFLKPRYGSSAAGVIALQRHRDGRLSAYSSARRDASGRVFNHLRVSRYSRRSDIAALVDAIAAQGAYAEAWVRKPRAPSPQRGHYDLRVVAHAGQARQRVARISRSPMTNLHLGNARAQPDWLDPHRQASLARTIAAAAQAFPGCHSIGFDAIVTPHGTTLLEANAFGDLLPGLRHDGCETYDDQASLMCHAN
ncbi:hypothetical protein DFR29_103137 [Tahibacter aquaticus]|uniref:ATP-grasp domain-containing protein n=1 Tax=Tahibacter aquaticus TaxID=520092 RepID=A0A4R6Z4K1_9GAMM|nr:STM4014 family protein [Tahibacter aquaticus]TDR46603.1 hypothetical protein DFR29_103137 [Tahibacter aquaticus]